MQTVIRPISWASVMPATMTARGRAEGPLEAAWHAAEHCDVFLSVGTSNLVEPAASLPWHAHRHGAEVIVVNTTSEGQRSGERIHWMLGKAGEVLPAVVGG